MPYDSLRSPELQRLKAGIDALIADSDALGQSMVACHLQMASDMLAKSLNNQHDAPLPARSLSA